MSELASQQATRIIRNSPEPLLHRLLLFLLLAQLGQLRFRHLLRLLAGLRLLGRAFELLSQRLEIFFAHLFFAGLAGIVLLRLSLGIR